MCLFMPKPHVGILKYVISYFEIQTEADLTDPDFIWSCTARVVRHLKTVRVCY